MYNLADLIALEGDNLSTKLDHKLHDCHGMILIWSPTLLDTCIGNKETIKLKLEDTEIELDGEKLQTYMFKAVIVYSEEESHVVMDYEARNCVKIPNYAGLDVLTGMLWRSQMWSTTLCKY